MKDKTEGGLVESQNYLVKCPTNQKQEVMHLSHPAGEVCPMCGRLRRGGEICNFTIEPVADALIIDSASRGESSVEILV